MQVGGVTEIIAHFVGELRIALENERVDVLLDGGVSRAMQPDVPRVLNDGVRPAPDDPLLDSRGILRPEAPLAEPIAFHIKAGLAALPAAKPLAALVGAAPALPKDVLPSISSGYNLKSYIRFDDGDLTPTQAHVSTVQDNALDDHDIFGPIEPGLELAARPGQLEDLVLFARSAGPDGSGIVDLKHHEMIEAVARLEHVQVPDGTHVLELAAGTTVDGVHVTSETSSTPPFKLAFANPFEGWDGIDKRPEADLPKGQQSVEAGGNSAANVAIMVDATGQTASMIVAGDVHRTNTIVQVNVLHDDDHVVHNGAGQSLLDSGNNHVSNSATFEDVGVYKSLGEMTGFPGKWTTTVLDGDFYAVQSLIQRNWMMDDDIIVRQESTNDFSLVTGHNAGVNNAAFVVNGMSFDMIIIGGSLYSANAIYQHNVVLDDDRVVLSGQDDDALWKLSTGSNSLTNEAWIRDIGSGSFQPMSAAAKAAASAVLSGEGQVELGKIIGLAAPGGESLDILVVTGNYYDIRLVSQFNVLSDADTVASLAPTPGGSDAGDETSVAQIIHAGSNSASNLAAIINVGTLTETQFAGGQIYEAATLIQTNIITADATTTVHAFDALAPEVVAFIEHDPYGHGYGANEDALSQSSTLHPVTQNPDVLGSIMT